ncbi:unnamed protein product [Blepharisma stoltei]|uniref:Choline transporter-like protein n=1 Tax=Blepharisma stoltei TaxID=1481888 RepID=A0AAU9IJW4_9CILI|nr:unnamed protein product [Blepharisma stoltei]
MGNKNSENKTQPTRNEYLLDSKSQYNKHLDPNYTGEPIDDSIYYGPTYNRKCTDFLFLFLFIAFLLAWIIIGFYGFAHGDPDLLTHPYDSSGNQCGIGSASDYKYLYYPFPLSGYFNYSVCIKDCPDSYEYNITCYKTHIFKDCIFGFEEYSNEPLSEYGYIRGVYPTTGYFSRFCFPDTSNRKWLFDSYDEVRDTSDYQILIKWFSDVIVTWPVIGIVVAVAFGFAFIYLIFLRYFIGIVVWLSILGVFSALLIFAALIQWTATNKYQDDTDKETRKTLWAFSAFLYAFDALFLIYIVFMCNRIRLAIAIMKTSTLFLKDVWYAIFVPPLFFAITVVFYIYWVCAILYLYSDGKIKKNSESPYLSWNGDSRNAIVFEFFGMLWVNTFIVALNNFILSSAVCIWYFSQNTDSRAQTPISTSFYRAFRYHQGSLAFGSFLLAIIWAIKIVLKVLKAVLKSTQTKQKENKLIVLAISCLICYANCFERFAKFINKNAYIQIAIQSTSFCKAARDAYFLILRNAARFLTLGTIGGIFMVLGKWVITIFTTWVGYMIITNNSKWNDKIYSPVFPTIVFLFISYIIASLFIGIYETACDCLLQCFLIDEEFSNKKQRAPEHAPELLVAFMNRERDPGRASKRCCC